MVHSCYSVSSYTWAGISFGHKLGDYGYMFTFMRWCLSVFRAVLRGVQSMDMGLRLPTESRAGGHGGGHNGGRGLGLPAYKVRW